MKVLNKLRRKLDGFHIIGTCYPQKQEKMIWLLM